MSKVSIVNKKITLLLIFGLSFTFIDTLHSQTTQLSRASAEYTKDTNLKNTNLGTQATSDLFPIRKLYQYADAFNIEGARATKSLNQKSLWVNLAMILDRPIIEGVTLDEITDANPYPLKEMSMDDYNETNVNLSLLLITNYYINNGHRLVQKSSNKPLKIMIQVHRNSSGPKMIERIASLLSGCLTLKTEMQKTEKGLPTLIIPDKNTTIVFRKGSKPESDLSHYEDVDILFSVSLLGGLNPKLKTGALTMPSTFIPFDINNYDLFIQKKYNAVNNLAKDINEILAQPQEIYFEKLNTLYKSVNLKKKFQARKLTPADFHPVTLLQIEGNFYPKDPERVVKVIKN